MRTNVVFDEWNDWDAEKEEAGPRKFELLLQADDFSSSQYFFLTRKELKALRNQALDALAREKEARR